MEEQRDQQIIAYLNNELSKEDKAAFELAIAQDKALAEEVELYGDLYDVHENLGIEQSIQRANDAFFRKVAVASAPISTTTKKSTAPKSFWKQGLSIAAGFLLLLAVGVWWANRNYSDERLTMEFHTPILNNIQADVPVQKTVFQDAESAFFAGEFNKTISLTATIQPENEITYYKAQYLQAFANFRIKNYTKSIEEFTKILDEFIDLLPAEYQNEDQIRWTRLLAFVGNHQDDTEVFQVELTYFIKGKSEVYQAKAKQLQQQLDSPWRKLVF